MTNVVASSPGVKDQSKSVVTKTRQLTGGASQNAKAAGVTSFLSSDSHVKQDIDFASKYCFHQMDAESFVSDPYRHLSCLIISIMSLFNI